MFTNHISQYHHIIILAYDVERENWKKQISLSYNTEYFIIILGIIILHESLIQLCL